MARSCVGLTIFAQPPRQGQLALTPASCLNCRTKPDFCMSCRSAPAVGFVDVWTRRTMRTVQRDASSSDERRRETLTLCGNAALWAIGGLHTAAAPPQAGPGKERDTVAPEAVSPPMTGMARRTSQHLSRDADALRHVAAGRLGVVRLRRRPDAYAALPLSLGHPARASHWDALVRLAAVGDPRHAVPPRTAPRAAHGRGRDVALAGRGGDRPGRHAQERRRSCHVQEVFLGCGRQPWQRSAHTLGHSAAPHTPRRCRGAHLPHARRCGQARADMSQPLQRWRPMQRFPPSSHFPYLWCCPLLASQVPPLPRRSARPRR